MKYLKLIILIISSVFYLSSSAQILSDHASVSILTCEVGDEIYSLFGHSAIRVKDGDIDEIYNYGTFNGFDENFELKFAKGKLDYSLSRQSLDGFLHEYQYYNRSVSEQTLNIPQNKKQEIYEFLLNNNLPENRKYKYDFFYDNCATRLRDILENVLGGDLIFGEHEWHNEFSFREVISKDLIKVPLTHFGIDLVLGQRIDVKVSSYDLMFHPIYLEEILSKSSYKGESLISAKKAVFQSTDKEPFKLDKTLQYIMWVVFVLGVLLTMFKIDRFGKIIDITLIYVFGLTGLLLIVMWFGTDHPATKYNWNILWMNPLLFLFPVMTKKRNLNYFKWMNILYFAICISWYILPQSFSPLSIPLILYLALRYFYYYRRLR